MKYSFINFILMSSILLLVGPTSFFIGIILSIFIFYKVPIWLSSLLISIYIFDIFINKPHNNDNRMIKKFKEWNGWRHVYNWFNMKVHIDGNLNIDQNKQYIFGIHPHGVFSWGSSIIFCDHIPECSMCKDRNCCSNSDFKGIFKNMKMNYFGASIVFKIPLIREICFLFGIMDATKENILNNLNNNKSVAINIDGIAGVLTTKPGKDSVVLKNRKGFIKLALSKGTPIIPIYQFGLVDTYETENELCLPVQKFFHKYLKIGLPIFFTKTYWCLPYRNTGIDIVVGQPIDIPKLKNEQIDNKIIDFYHQKYIKELQLLYNNWKHKFGYQNRILEILDARQPY